MKKIFGLAAILTFALWSCGGGSDGPETPEDKEKPQMTISSPANNATITKGDYLKLTGTFTDDVALKELFVSIAAVTTKSATGIDDPWEPSSQTIAMEGTEMDLVAKKLFDEIIPADCLTGPYNLKLVLRDGVGNETVKEIAITIN